VQDALCVLLIATTSYTDPEFAQVCGRIYELSQQVGDHALLAPAMFRLGLHHVMRVDLVAGTELGDDLVDTEWPGYSPATAVGGHFTLGWLSHERGDQPNARRHLDIVIEMCAAGHDAGLIHSVIENPAVITRNISAVVWWLSGRSDRAEAESAEALDMALASGGRGTWSTMVCFWAASTVAMLERDADLTLARCDEGIALAIAGGYGLGVPYMGANRGWARAALGEPDDGAAEIVDRAALASDFGAVYMHHVFLGLLADAYLMGGRVDEAMTALDDAFRSVLVTKETWYEAELHRLRGEALTALGADPHAVGDEYRSAIQIASAQGAVGLRRRAEASLSTFEG
jgi:hypothetical protein